MKAFTAFPLALALTAQLLSSSCFGEADESDKKAKEAVEGSIVTPSVHFKKPKDKAVVKSPFGVEMEVRGMTVQPSGKLVVGGGHHHILINKDPIKEGELIPLGQNENYLHFGQGETKAKVSLKPGTYRLTLQFADGEHKSYGPRLSETIQITVK